jgi:hypothetical protein
MRSSNKWTRLWAVVAGIACWSVLAAGVTAPGQAEEKAGNAEIGLAEGKLQLTAPKTWVRKQPKTRIVEHEFAVPVAEGDSIEGRFTVMGAGGGVEANIDRWLGQFTQPDGSSTKEKAKIQKMQVNGVEVHFVDIGGNFKDQPGPFAPAVTRENYRMLGAIIVTEKSGMHFLKLYGPKATIGGQEQAFKDMLNGLKVK